MMLKPRFDWHCDQTGCCVFVGGTADYDIYMAGCHNSPYDPMVLFITDYGEAFQFKNQADMDASIDKWDRELKWPDGATREGVLAAQNFVHLFFPSPVLVAMDRISKGLDL